MIEVLDDSISSQPWVEILVGMSCGIRTLHKMCLPFMIRFVDVSFLVWVITYKRLLKFIPLWLKQIDDILYNYVGVLTNCVIHIIVIVLYGQTIIIM